jgi:nicotinamidase-related amidase
MHVLAPDESRVVLLLIDVINDLSFPEADELLRFALPMAERLRALKRRARRAGVPAIYVNDNFGRWRSDFAALIEHCERSRGKKLTRLLRPARDDYFVLKPKHSGFYSTTLEVLLQNIGASRLIVTGIATNICVLFTANDAYMRDFDVTIPADCVAANTAEESERALDLMKRILKADVRSSSEIRFGQAERKRRSA